MRIVRGVMLCIGIVLVFLASCADQWNPGYILTTGGIGLGLCLVAKLLPEEIRGRRRKRW